MELHPDSLEKHRVSQDQDDNKQDNGKSDKDTLKETSLSTLITWNIYKVFEKNPDIDLKVAFETVQARLDESRQDVNEIITQFPEHRHLACALLAWKELGHKSVNSLYDFFISDQNDDQNEVLVQPTSSSRPDMSKPDISNNVTVKRNCKTSDYKCFTKIRPNEMTMICPNERPSICPNERPSVCPNERPSICPNERPSVCPKERPFIYPNERPYVCPNERPFICPNERPFICPNEGPFICPNEGPFICPNEGPFVYPNERPSICPNEGSFIYPDERPSVYPNEGPSICPNEGPFICPNERPSVCPNERPSICPNEGAMASAQKRNSSKVGPLFEIPVMNPQYERRMSMERKVSADPSPIYQNYDGSRVPLYSETTVMRFESNQHNQQPKNEPKPKKNAPLDKDLLRKIDEVCCLESGCAERLSALGQSTKNLRTRATDLARREAERLQILERAENAWKELERGYQKRLSLGVEKEEDLARQIKALIKERSEYKSKCSNLVNGMKDHGDAEEKARAKLAEVENEVCQLACQRLQLSEELAKEDAALAHQQCLSAQLDRDLQFKEEQASRKVKNMESELESAMGLMHETERALRLELSGQREQLLVVSNDLIEEDKRNAAIVEDVNKLDNLKKEMSEDLNGCKYLCDEKMQNTVDELAKKREQLEQLKEKKIACRCKNPKDESVTVKRTTSLAALCRCSPEEKFLESCSCTSLRSSLLTNLLSDLFGGLQSEICETGLEMPCQMLKCLENKHNWDKPSNVKSLLQKFFSRLLVKELEIAVATSIENYHARWVGTSCADTVRRSIPDFEDVDSEGWQQRALERRANQVAEILAEKMFQERTNAILQQAKDIVEKGPPPCECTNTNPCQCMAASVNNLKNISSSGTGKRTDIFSCFLNGPSMATKTKLGDSTQTKPVTNKQSVICKKVNTSYCKELHACNPTIACNDLKPKHTGYSNNNRATGTLALDFITKSQDLQNCSPECLRQAMDDVLQLRDQIDELKKESIKKNDLLMMEKYIVKLIQQKMDNCELENATHYTPPPPSETSLDKKGLRSPSVRTSPTPRTAQNYPNKKPITTIKKIKRQVDTENIKKKPYTRPGQLFAVNLCLCGETKAQKEIRLAKMKDRNNLESRSDLNPEENPTPKSEQSCKSDCVCLNKNPSSTSINKFLETMAKWRYDLIGCNENNETKNSDKSENMNSLHTLVENQNLNQEKPQSILNPNKFPKISYLIETSQTKSRQSINFEHPVVATTESVYMGDVNLEKSNDTLCRCTIAKQMDKNMHAVNDFINSEFALKDLNSCSCCPRNFDMNNPNSSSVLNKTRIKQNSSCLIKKRIQKSIKPKSADIKKSDTQKLTNTKSSAIKNSDTNAERKACVAKNISNSGHDEKIIIQNEETIPKITDQGDDKTKNYEEVPTKLEKNTPDISKIVQNAFYPGDCDYQIKFIGVTLTDESSKTDEKVLGNKPTSTYSGLYLPPLLPRLIDKNIKKEYSESTQSKIKTDQKSTDHNINNNQFTSCQCNVNFDELKNFFDNTFNKQIGDFVANDDKKVDTNSLNDSRLDAPEPCVCHNNVKKEESRELEVNTFNLIQEHLKQQIQQFKQHCNSCCLTHDEEEKFYTTVMQKIKQVIIDSTNAVSCQCKEEQEGQDSWNRAYELLQEYIRTKIKRVQCVCVIPESESNNIVPDVTEQVCCLIKNDFKRLKNICAYKKVENMPEKTSYDTELITKKCNIKKGSMIPKNSLYSTFAKDAAFNINSSLFQNLSSQVSNTRIEYESKSCDAINKPHENTQTEESQNNSVDTYTEYICSNSGFQENSQQISDIHLEKDDANKTSKVTIKMPFAKSAPLPFIGYTIDCSCGSDLLYCVCSKSTVKNNNTKIDNMWKQFTNRKVDETKVAYIMDNVDKSHKSESEGFSNQTTNDVVVCDINTCTNCEDVIILKDSDQHCNRKDHTTNTYFQEACKTMLDLNIDDPYRWLECESPSDVDEHLSSRRELSAKQDKSESIKPRSKNEDCNCDMVPVCHVKMLLENIENKLTNSECTCDSMVSIVCPIHSRKSNI